VPVTPAAAGAPRLSYREFVGGVAVFESSVATGKLLVPSASDCPCQDGLFALRFAAGGEDVRWLDRGHLGPPGAPCLAARSLDVGDGLEVVPACDRTPADPEPSGGGSDGGAIDDGGDDAAPDGCAQDDGTDDSAGDGCDSSESSDEGCDQGSSG